MSRSRSTALFATVVALPLLLSACGGSSTSDATASSPAATASAAPSSTALAGGDPSTWAPVELTQAENGTVLNWQVGQSAILTDLPAPDANNQITVMSTNPTIVEPVQGDGTTTNPGFRAIAPGYAQIIVWDGAPADRAAQPIEQFVVQVTNDPNADGNPWNGSPYSITEKTITLRAGETAMWEDMTFGKKTVTSNNGLVAQPWTKDDAKVPGFTAIGVGTTVVKVKNAKGKVLGKVKVTVTP